MVSEIEALRKRPWAMVGSRPVFSGLSKEHLNNFPLRCMKILRPKAAPMRMAVEDHAGVQYSLPVAKVVSVAIEHAGNSPQDEDDKSRLSSLSNEKTERGLKEMDLDPYTIQLLKCKPLEGQLFDCHGLVSREASARGNGWSAVIDRATQGHYCTGSIQRL